MNRKVSYTFPVALFALALLFQLRDKSSHLPLHVESKHERLASPVGASPEETVLVEQSKAIEQVGAAHKNSLIDLVLADAQVIDEKTVQDSSTRNLLHIRLVRTDHFSYPVVEVVDEYVGSTQKTLLRRTAHVGDHVLVSLKSTADQQALDRLNRKYGTSILKKLYGGNDYILQFSSARAGSANHLVKELQKEDSLVTASQVNPLVATTQEIAKDPLFELQYALTNYGRDGGLPGADIDAAQAWQIANGFGTNRAPITVAVIDTGIDYSHPDLRDNMWNNPGEIPGNNSDDDRDGLVDNVFGANFANTSRAPLIPSGDPMDHQGHGTACASVLGARGFNKLGMAGVIWNVKLLAVKVFEQQEGGVASDIIQGLRFARAKNVRLTANSYSSRGDLGPLFQAELAAHSQAGILFVAAAGNDADNNDSIPQYPGNYRYSNVITVAATDNRDQLAPFSNYGLNHVDIAAPGMQIVALAPVRKGVGYVKASGTSLAVPHVAGVAALLLAKEPHLKAVDIKDRILRNADELPNLRSRIPAGARLNAHRALADVVPEELGTIISTPFARPTATRTSQPTPTANTFIGPVAPTPVPFIGPLPFNPIVVPTLAATATTTPTPTRTATPTVTPTPTIDKFAGQPLYVNSNNKVKAFIWNRTSRQLVLASESALPTISGLNRSDLGLSGGIDELTSHSSVLSDLAAYNGARTGFVSTFSGFSSSWTAAAFTAADLGGWNATSASLAKRGGTLFAANAGPAEFSMPAAEGGIIGFSIHNRSSQKWLLGQALRKLKVGADGELYVITEDQTSPGSRSKYGRVSTRTMTISKIFDVGNDHVLRDNQVAPSALTGTAHGVVMLAGSSKTRPGRSLLRLESSGTYSYRWVELKDVIEIDSSVSGDLVLSSSDGKIVIIDLLSPTPQPDAYFTVGTGATFIAFGKPLSARSLCALTPQLSPLSIRLLEVKSLSDGRTAESGSFGTGSYEDLTKFHLTSLARGTQVKLTFEAGIRSQVPVPSHRYTVFLDLNGNGTVGEAGERLGTTSGNLSSSTTQQLQFTVPQSERVGSTVLRVVQHDTTALTSICNGDGFRRLTPFKGEVEDYTVVIK